MFFILILFLIFNFMNKFKFSSCHVPWVFRKCIDSIYTFVALLRRLCLKLEARSQFVSFHFIAKKMRLLSASLAIVISLSSL